MYSFSSPPTKFLHSHPPTIKIPLQKRSIHLNFTQFRRTRNIRFRPFPRQPSAFFRKSESKNKTTDQEPPKVISPDEEFISRVFEEDFISRVLKENPTQVEPKHLVGGKFYKEKKKIQQVVEKKKIQQVVEKKLKGEKEEKDEKDKKSDFGEDVKLKDMLKDFRGKLYVPEEAFGQTLSEEVEFDRSFESLPKMELKDFMEALEENRIRLLKYKDDVHAFTNEFIIELEEEEVPGIENSHRSITMWALELNEDEALLALAKYDGPRYKVEHQYKAWVAKLPEYPHPVASSISGRVIVEFGTLTAAIAVAALAIAVAAAAIAAVAVAVGGSLASAVFVVTSFLFAGAAYSIWPICKTLMKLTPDFITNALQVVGEDLYDLVIAGQWKFHLRGVFAFIPGLGTLTKFIPLAIALGSFALVIRFTISSRSKNFRKWDIWQGMEFSQSKAQARVDGSTGVTFKDVAGIDSAVEELQELVKYLKNPDLFEKMGIKPPHGVLLEGPPGCGKTLVAKAIAGEAGVPFYQMAGSEFIEVLVGVGSARIRDLFKRAKVHKPSVIFIDEIDALATRRQGILQKAKNYVYDAATQERETALNQLLIELDGFDTGKGVIFLGATNRKDLLDPALLRPGRFDRKIRIQPPDAQGRLDILKVHARKVKLSDSVDLRSFTQDLPGWSGAKLAQLLQEAALVAVRKRHKSIIQSDLEEAVDRLTVGPKIPGVNLDYRGQCRRALTEAGIVVVSHLLRRNESASVERCDRISIHPRGETLSQILFHRLDEDSLMFERRPQLLQRIQVFLGGRAAEEVIFGRDTSLESAKYLPHASWLARKIISGWNLENAIVIHGESAPWPQKNKYVGPRLDFEGNMYREDGLSAPPLNLDIDDEVARRTEELVHDMYDKTVSLLRQHNAALVKTVKVLLKQLEISGEEIDFILDHYPPNTPASLILEEGDPGGLPLFHKQNEQVGQELEYDLLPQ